MKILENILLFEYFVLTVCGLRVTHEDFFSKPYTIWGNQNDHVDSSDQRIDTRTKRSLFECGVHGEKPSIDSLSAQTTLPGEWPWMVAVVRIWGKKFSFVCGASLIDNRFAITAAYCIYRRFSYGTATPDGTAIIVGVRDVSRETYDEDSIRSLTAKYMHEEYDYRSSLNNIALLVLKEPVTYTKLVKPVCLWEGKDDEDDLEKAFKYGTMVGWGTVNGVDRLQEPLRFNISIMSLTTCRESEPPNLRTYFAARTFCAASEKVRRGGFHGSGLFIEQHSRWTLRGIHTSSLLNTPIYTDVAKYRNWISDTAYRWLQTNLLSLAPITSAAGNHSSLTQQCSMRGEDVSLIFGREDEWPWHVAIYHHEDKGNSSSISYKCGGSLISTIHVLTAAHCLIDRLTNRVIRARRINIFLGTKNIKYFSVDVQIRMIDQLENPLRYNAETLYDNIALLKLNKPADITVGVRPVCLWPEDKVDLSNIVGKNGSVVSWGRDENDQLAEDLMLAELPVVSQLTCIRSNIFYHKYTNNFTFCAGQLQDTTVCKSDSGAGMVFKLRSGAGKEEWFLRGIVSVRPATATPCDSSHYLLFTDVAKHIDWIKNSVSLDMAYN